jgi:hypothetical protein
MDRHLEDVLKGLDALAEQQQRQQQEEQEQHRQEEIERWRQQQQVNGVTRLERVESYSSELDSFDYNHGSPSKPGQDDDAFDYHSAGNKHPHEHPRAEEKKSESRKKALYAWGDKP